MAKDVNKTQKKNIGKEEIKKQPKKEFEKKKKVVIVALVDTLKYLQKGGRISKSIALTGKILNIKPVLSAVEGVIQMVGKARGSKRGNHQLVYEIEKAGGVDFEKPLLLGYTGLSDALLRKYIQDSAALWGDHLDSLPYEVVGSVVGTHAGPGAVAVAFFASDCE